MDDNIALVKACKSGNTDFVEYLLSHGGDPNSRQPDEGSCLGIACKNGHQRIVELLVHYGASVNEDQRGSHSPLCVATAEGNAGIVDLLLQNGADCTVRNSYGLTPLHLACAHGHAAILLLLLQACKSSNTTQANIFAQGLNKEPVWDTFELPTNDKLVSKTSNGNTADLGTNKNDSDTCISSATYEHLLSEVTNITQPAEESFSQHIPSEIGADKTDVVALSSHIDQLTIGNSRKSSAVPNENMSHADMQPLYPNETSHQQAKKNEMNPLSFSHHFPEGNSEGISFLGNATEDNPFGTKSNKAEDLQQTVERAVSFECNTANAHVQKNSGTDVNTHTSYSNPSDINLNQNTRIYHASLGDNKNTKGTQGVVLDQDEIDIQLGPDAEYSDLEDFVVSVFVHNVITAATTDIEEQIANNNKALESNSEYDQTNCPSTCERGGHNDSAKSVDPVTAFSTKDEPKLVQFLDTLGSRIYNDAIAEVCCRLNPEERVQQTSDKQICLQAQEGINENHQPMLSEAPQVILNPLQEEQEDSLITDFVQNIITRVSNEMQQDTRDPKLATDHALEKDNLPGTCCKSGPEINEEDINTLVKDVLAKVSSELINEDSMHSKPEASNAKDTNKAFLAQKQTEGTEGDLESGECEAEANKNKFVISENCNILEEDYGNEDKETEQSVFQTAEENLHQYRSLNYNTVSYLENSPGVHVAVSSSGNLDMPDNHSPSAHHTPLFRHVPISNLEAPAKTHCPLHKGTIEGKGDSFEFAEARDGSADSSTERKLAVPKKNSPNSILDGFHTGEPFGSIPLCHSSTLQGLPCMQGQRASGDVKVNGKYSVPEAAEHTTIHDPVTPLEGVKSTVMPDNIQGENRNRTNVLNSSNGDPDYPTWVEEQNKEDLAKFSKCENIALEKQNKTVKSLGTTLELTPNASDKSELYNTGKKRAQNDGNEAQGSYVRERKRSRVDIQPSEWESHWSKAVNAQTYDGKTALYLACENGRCDIVDILLSHGARGQLAESHFGLTPLHIACLRDGGDTVQLYLRQNVRDIDLQSEDGSTPFYIACSLGKIDIITTLCEQGADCEVGRQDGWSPLHVACEKGHEEVVNFLLRENVNVNCRNDSGATPLYQAARFGHSKVVKLLLDNGAGVNLTTKGGWSPLHIAAKNGHHPAIDLLLAEGADINLPSESGATALFQASKVGNMPTTEYLLGRQADYQIKNKEGLSPLLKASLGDFDRIVQILVAHGAEINEQWETTGFTALHLACIQGATKTAKVLIDRMANIYMPDHEGFLPIEWAQEFAHHEITEMLNWYENHVTSFLLSLPAIEPVLKEGQAEDLRVWTQLHPHLAARYIPVRCPSDRGSVWDMVSIALCGNTHFSTDLRKVSAKVLLTQPVFSHLLRKSCGHLLVPETNQSQALQVLALVSEALQPNSKGNEPHLLAMSIAVQRPIYIYTSCQTQRGSYYQIRNDVLQLVAAFKEGAEGTRQHLRFQNEDCPEARTRRPLFGFMKDGHFTALLPKKASQEVFIPLTNPFEEIFSEGITNQEEIL